MKTITFIFVEFFFASLVSAQDQEFPGQRKLITAMAFGFGLSYQNIICMIFEGISYSDI
jgi:hypothetical protein